jgi:hypothetical protein
MRTWGAISAAHGKKAKAAYAKRLARQGQPLGGKIEVPIRHACIKRLANPANRALAGQNASDERGGEHQAADTSGKNDRQHECGNAAHGVLLCGALPGISQFRCAGRV